MTVHSDSVPGRIYFARAIDYRNHDEIRSSFDAAAKALEVHGFEVVDPTASLAGWEIVDGSVVPSGVEYGQIVEGELSQLRDCDLLLVDMSIPNHTYFGCIAEIVYAHLWKMPVAILVSDSSMKTRQIGRASGRERV